MNTTSDPGPAPSPAPRPPGEATSLRGLPAVVVHGRADIAAVLSRGRGATLLSARGAALFAGVGWWRALVADARADWPGVAFDDVLDCADAPGRVVEALRLGQRAMVLDPGCAAWPALRALALHEGAVLLGTRPAALDLGERGAGRKLGAWLGG